MNRIKSITDVVGWRLCLGCGACAYMCPEKAIRLYDFPEEGIRPVLNEAGCTDCGHCLKVCPALQTDWRIDPAAVIANPTPQEKQCTDEWGPVAGIWEGYATDTEIRFKGSSGGVLTALSLYCLEVLEMKGVLHIAADAEDPLRNRTRMSHTRKDLIEATGSRYSPAAVCNGLDLVEQAVGPCAIIGKPAEIAAIQNARRMKRGLIKKIGVTLSFFCAETPSTQGTIDLLKTMGVDAPDLKVLRYRGRGWPGLFAPTQQNETKPTRSMSYKESWSYLQAYRPWSIQLWPDGSGELADISCGDPWYSKPDDRNAGLSLVIARTTRGLAIVEGAIAAGYLKMDVAPTQSWSLDKHQQGLSAKKGAVWGRLKALRLLGLPTPKFSGINLFLCWRQLSVREQLRSTLGTVRRVFVRHLLKPLRLDLSLATEVKEPIP